MWLFIHNSTVQPGHSQLTKSSPWLAQVTSEAAQLSPSPHPSHLCSWLYTTFFVFLLHQPSPEWSCSLAPSRSLLPYSKPFISIHSLGLSYSREHWHNYQLRVHLWKFASPFWHQQMFLRCPGTDFSERGREECVCLNCGGWDQDIRLAEQLSSFFIPKRNTPHSGRTLLPSLMVEDVTWLWVAILHLLGMLGLARNHRIIE